MGESGDGDVAAVVGGGLGEADGVERMQVEVFFRRDEGQVGFEETDAHEERFARGGGGFEASDGFGGDLAVGVEIVGDGGGFDGGAVGFFGMLVFWDIVGHVQFFSNL